MPAPMLPIAVSTHSSSCVGARRSPVSCFYRTSLAPFFVLVMSSSAGAAIGVTEGIAVILHQSEYLPSLGDKLVLFAVGIAFFGVPLQVGFALLTLIQRRLGRIATGNQEALVEAPRVT